MWFVIQYYYYHNIFILLFYSNGYDYETECSFVYLIFTVLLHKFQQWYWAFLLDLYLSIGVSMKISRSPNLIHIDLPVAVMTSYRCSKMAAMTSKIFCPAVTTLAYDCRPNLFADKISTKCFNPQLIYYYFRFRKTNCRHIGIIIRCVIIRLRFDIGMPFCIGLSNIIQVEQTAAELQLRHISF